MLMVFQKIKTKRISSYILKIAMSNAPYFYTDMYNCSFVGGRDIRAELSSDKAFDKLFSISFSMFCIRISLIFKANCDEA